MSHATYHCAPDVHMRSRSMHSCVSPICIVHVSCRLRYGEIEAPAAVVSLSEDLVSSLQSPETLLGIKSTFSADVFRYPLMPFPCLQLASILQAMRCIRKCSIQAAFHHCEAASTPVLGLIPLHCDSASAPAPQCFIAIVGSCWNTFMACLCEDSWLTSSSRPAIQLSDLLLTHALLSVLGSSFWN